MPSGSSFRSANEVNSATPGFTQASYKRSLYSLLHFQERRYFMNVNIETLLSRKDICTDTAGNMYGFVKNGICGEHLDRPVDIEELIVNYLDITLQNKKG